MRYSLLINLTGKRETESRFDRILDEMRRDREEQRRKWDEHQKTIEHVLNTLDAFVKKYQSDIGAIGSRWGMQSEEAFRNALKSILEQSFDVEVINVNDFDESGEVFGRPDQVELDVKSNSTNGCISARLRAA